MSKAMIFVDLNRALLLHMHYDLCILRMYKPLTHLVPWPTTIKIMVYCTRILVRINPNPFLVRKKNIRYVWVLNYRNDERSCRVLCHRRNGARLMVLLVTSAGAIPPATQIPLLLSLLQLLALCRNLTCSPRYL